ncbi:penicillin acylase family protein [Massilia sp. Root418]|jgi:acyl-homoserine-lactone acylase|uniref:penicillin acylase family protein n=1 Tax=Massilia sp. Root418 TaxID=1736532 RepID=UPI0009E665A9|nr:penicillin acylase family protein [Massilia sp. Root418]
MRTQVIWLLAAAVTAGAAAEPFRSEVTRTSYGVVHVKAADFRNLGYGLGHAYAEDNVCMLADTLLTVRGERSRYFGADAYATKPKNGEYGAAIDYVTLRNEDSDFFFKGYLDLAQLRAGYAAGSQEVRDVLTGYVAGYNRYLRDNSASLPAACKGAAWVKAMTMDDMYLLIAEKALHATGEVFAGAIVAAAREPAAAVALAKSIAPASRKIPMGMPAGLGSNGLAVGKGASANGRGLLLGNPHYPWNSADRFYQVHLTVPGKYDAMGASLGGMPAVVIGFNKDMAWTHTVTKAVHFTTFKLDLDPADPTGTTYFYDGAPVKMTSRTVSVDSLQADGTLASKQKTFYFSKQGAVLVMPEAGVDWTASTAFVLGDANRNNTRLVQQWLAIGKAGNVAAVKSTLGAIAGLPWVNTVAADREGNTLYMDGSAVPNMGADKFVSDCLVLPELVGFDGSRSECAWGQDPDAPAGIFGAANMPQQERTDYVANSNDGYWLTNARELLTGPAPYGYSPLYGSTDVEQTLRTRIGFKQLEAALTAERFLDTDDLQRLMFANRVHAAELILPELLPACLASNDRQLLLACAVLMIWDRKADLDSRGAVLFREFWNAAAAIPGKWKVPFDAADPVNTPRGLAPAAVPAMLDALRAAVAKLNAQAVPLYGRLGDYQYELRNGKRYPLHGGIGDIDGAYNSINMASELSAAGYGDVSWGTSYVQVVGFDQAGPVAKGLLVYGQSVDPKSPHYADQLPLYGRKALFRLPFTDTQIRSDAGYKLKVLSEN